MRPTNFCKKLFFTESKPYIDVKTGGCWRSSLERNQSGWHGRRKDRKTVLKAFCHSVDLLPNPKWEEESRRAPITSCCPTAGLPSSFGALCLPPDVMLRKVFGVKSLWRCSPDLSMRGMLWWRVRELHFHTECLQNIHYAQSINGKKLKKNKKKSSINWQKTDKSVF